MEAAPPSYEKATLIDPWDLIARYIPSNDLCSAASVCTKWHTVFIPHLWGNPASHFGLENVFVALTKFKRTLQTARLLVRSQTHTLHLPPADAEIYSGPNATWLREILERLPNLQSLIVRGLPFFDYSALQALKYKRPSVTSLGDGLPPGTFELAGSDGIAFQRPIDDIPSFGLRLLDASRCSNVTASSLAQALKRFEGLLYLDLSFTLAARDLSVFKAIRRFHGLQVVKLRGIGLQDDMLMILAASIGRRVRSLDIRNNYISDRGIRTLLDECFISTNAGPNAAFSNGGQRSPALLSYLGHEMLDIYQGEDFESFIRNAFTGRFISRMAIEDAPEGGITHLYISGNNVSVEGIAGLVRSGRLHVLDTEAVLNVPTSPLRRSSFYDPDPGLEAPGVETLTPVLASCASTSMKLLRIDHALVTKDGPSTRSAEIVQGRCELDNTELPPYRDTAEIDGTMVQPDVFEMPTAQSPKYELPGDPMRFVVTLAANDAQHERLDEGPSAGAPRRGSAFAPEVVLDASSSVRIRDPASSPISGLDENGTFRGHLNMTPISPETSMAPPPSDSSGIKTYRRSRTYSSVTDERRARLNAHIATKHNLHPAMLPNLSTLVLTSIPPFSTNPEISDRLIHFIIQCASESQLARHHARLDYSLPPGRKGHASALKHSAEKIFALKRIILELAPDSPSQRSRRASQWQYANTKSVTEDRDSESLWSAAETDFSFFAEADEDDIFPSLDSKRYTQPFGSSEKEISPADVPPLSPSLGNGRTVQPPPPPLRFDNVALLSAFRRERKLAHERNLAAGAIDTDTEGFWDGSIKIVRQDRSNPRIDETAGDYHSTRFDHGHLYQ